MVEAAEACLNLRVHAVRNQVQGRRLCASTTNKRPGSRTKFRPPHFLPNLPSERAGLFCNTFKPTSIVNCLSLIMVRFDHYTLTVLLTATSIASVLSVPVSVPNTVTISRIEARIGPQTTVMGDPPSYSAKGRISEVVAPAQAQTQAAEPVGEQPYNANAVRLSKDQIQEMKEFLQNSGVKCGIEQHQLSSLFVELENPRNPYAVINLIHLVHQCDNVLPKHERYGVPLKQSSLVSLLWRMKHYRRRLNLFT
ncbi:hypothetical protein C8R42DRAFT_686731 [Lentinula raphanica]|nr:hypothetical protein C8R42DRAFT_686731 [Lentinula raphanica]